MAISHTLAHLRNRSVVIQPHEAVAIAQQLIHPLRGTRSRRARTARRAGPPSLETVWLEADGCVTSSCESTPAVSEIAIFLQSLLPSTTSSVPGGLRYAVARALLEVEARPFDSLEEFSTALSRFERGDRRQLVRAILASATKSPRERELERVSAGAASASVERRRASLAVADLRRELREMDRLLYEARSASASRAVYVPRWPRRWVPAAAVLATVSAAGGGWELRHQRAFLPAEPLSIDTLLAIDPPGPRALFSNESNEHRGSIRMTGRARPVRHSVAETSVNELPAHYSVGPVQAPARRSVPSAIVNALKFKWLKDVFTTKSE
jgi:hypothetical protein